MASVIDALTVTLALDPTEFTRGQKTAITAFKKTKEEATNAGKTIEAAGSTIGTSLEGIATKALAMFAVFAGARSIKDFVRDIGLADSALGRLAANLGTTPDRLSALTSAVERNGGSAQAAAGSFKSLSDSFEELKNTGNTGILTMLQRLQGQGGATIDMLHGFDKALPGIVANLKAMKDRGDAVGANWFGRQLGIDEETVNFLEQGWPKVQAEIERSRRLGVVSPESAKAGQALVDNLRSLRQEVVGVGRDIFVELSPQINGALHAMSEWIEKNKAWISSGIRDAIRDLAEVLRTIDWKAVMDGIAEFVKGANEAAKAVGGWKVVGEALLALWVGAKFTAALAALGRFRSLLALPLPPWALAILGLSVGSDLGVPNEKKPEIARRSDEEAGGLPGADTSPEDQRGAMGRAWGHVKRWFGGGGAEAAEVPKGGNYALRKRGASARTSFQQPGSDTRGNLSANQREAYGAALSEGLSPTAARALVANMSGEGLATPKDVHWDVSHYAHGIVQWDDVRSAAIKKQFGKMPNELSVADQTRAAIWEIRNRKEYAETKRALEGNDPGHMVDALVRNYERPADKAGAIRTRLGHYSRLGGLAAPVKTPPMVKVAPKTPAAASPAPAKEPTMLQTMWKGVPGAADAANMPAAASTLAASYHSNDNSKTSNSHTQVGSIHVTVPGGDSHEIAKNIGPAIERHSYAVHANYGTI